MHRAHRRPGFQDCPPRFVSLAEREGSRPDLARAISERRESRQREAEHGERAYQSGETKRTNRHLGEEARGEDKGWDNCGLWNV